MPGVFWHAGSVLALPEDRDSLAVLPVLGARGVRAAGSTVPIASHVHRLAADGGRVLFGVDDGGARDGGDVDDGTGIFLRIGEWDAAGALRVRPVGGVGAGDVAARHRRHRGARGVH